MDVCLRGEGSTRLRLRGVTRVLGIAVYYRDASTPLSVTLLLGLAVANRDASTPLRMTLLLEMVVI